MTSPTQYVHYEADPDRLAVLLPGGGYTPAAPLLHYARAVLQKHGWSIVEVWWDPPFTSVWEDFVVVVDWVCAQAREALAGSTASQQLIVGKSLGTCACGLAAERQLPAVWLTPILNHQRIVDAISNATAPTLLVGGTGDRLWDSEVAEGSGHEMLEVSDADHGMELANDPVASVDVLRQVTAEVDQFVGTL